MNIKSEPLSDKEGAEADEYFPTLRRSTRVKKSILDFSLIKPRRKKKAYSAAGDGDRETEQLTPQVKVKVEKSPLDIPLRREDDGGSPFLITLGPQDGAGLDDLEEIARSSESTLTAHSDVGSVGSAGSFATVSEEDPIFQEHSYCTNPRRTVRTHIKKEKKTMEAAPVAPKPTVDLSTLAIYRALMDHNYSTITPSALIEAVMLKHDYVCTFQALQDFPADMEPCEPVSTYLSHQRIKTEPGAVLQPSQHENIGGGSENIALPLTKKGRKRKSPEDQLVKNPKYRSPAKIPTLLSKDSKSSVKSPKPLSNDSKSLTKSSSPKKLIKTENDPVKEPSKKKKGSSGVAKTAVGSTLKKLKEVERKSLASKLKVELKMRKRKRRKNATGWPTKKPQAVDKKPKKLSKPKKDVTKVKNEKSSRDSSSTRSAEKDSKGAFIPSLTGVVLSIEEAVKRRRQPVAKSTAAEKPLAENEKNIGKTVSPRKFKTGQRKNEEGADELTEDGNETKAGAIEEAEKPASTDDRLGSEVDTKFPGISHTTLSKGQKPPNKSTRRSRQPIKPVPDTDAGEKTLDAAFGAESPQPASRMGLRKKVKRQLTSLLKVNCTSKNVSPQLTADVKSQESRGDVTPKKGKQIKFDGADSGTESASEGEKSEGKAASKPALKKGEKKVNWIRKKSNRTTNKSSKSKSKAKVKQKEMKSMKKRKTPLSPPTRRGETYGNIDCTEGLQTFTTVIIKEEPMETEIPDDSQPTDWDHFQNAPNNTEKSPEYHQKLDDTNKFCQFCVSRMTTNKHGAFAPSKTHSGGSLHDLKCYEKLDTSSEDSNRACTCKHKRMSHAFAGISKSQNPSIVAEEGLNSSDHKNRLPPVKNELDTHVNFQNPSSINSMPTSQNILNNLDERQEKNMDTIWKPATDFGPESVDSDHSLSAVPKMVKAVNKAQSVLRVSTDTQESQNSVVSKNIDCGEPSDEKLGNSKRKNSIEPTKASIEIHQSKNIRVENPLERETHRTTEGMKPSSTRNNALKYEDISLYKQSRPDVDTLLKKRRDERRLAREKRMKKRYAIKKQEMHQTQFYSQVIVSKPKHSKTAGESDINVEAGKTADQVNNAPDHSDNVDDKHCDIAEKPLTNSQLESSQTQNSKDAAVNENSVSVESDKATNRTVGVVDKECHPINNVSLKFFKTAPKILRHTKFSIDAESIRSVKLDHVQKHQNDHTEDMLDCSRATAPQVNLTGEADRWAQNLDSRKSTTECKEEDSMDKCNNPTEQSQDHSEELVKSNFNDSPFESSRENSDVGSSSGNVRVTAVPVDLPRPKPTKTAPRFKREFRIPPRIIRRSTVTRCALTAVDAVVEKQLCEGNISRNDYIEFRESGRVSLESSKNKSSLEEITGGHDVKPTSLVDCAGNVSNIVRHSDNQSQSCQDANKPGKNTSTNGSGRTNSGNNKEKIVDSVEKRLSVSGTETCNDFEVQTDATAVLKRSAEAEGIDEETANEPEDKESSLHMLVDDTRNSADATAQAGIKHQESHDQLDNITTRLDLANLNTVIPVLEVESPVDSHKNISVPMELPSLMGGSGNSPTEVISESNAIPTVARDLCNELGESDSDFSIVDPYASEPDDPSPAVQSLKPSPVTASSTVSGDVRVVKPVGSIANAKCDKPIIEDRHKVVLEEQDPLDNTPGQALINPNKIVKKFSFTVGKASGQRKPPRIDHQYCKNPLVEKSDKNARRNEKRRLAREQREIQKQQILMEYERQKLLRQKLDRSKLESCGNLEPIVIRYNNENMITAVEGLSSNVDPLRENDVWTGSAGVQRALAVKDVASRNPGVTASSDSSLIDSDEEYHPWMDDAYRERRRRARRMLIRQKQRNKKLAQINIQESFQRDPLECLHDPLEDVASDARVPNPKSQYSTSSVEMASRANEQSAEDPLADVSTVGPLHQYLQLKRSNPLPVLQSAAKPPLISNRGMDDSSGVADNIQRSQPTAKSKVVKRTFCFKVVGGKMQFRGESNQVHPSDAAQYLQQGSSEPPTSICGLNSDQGNAPQVHRMNVQRSDGKRYAITKVIVPSIPSLGNRQPGTNCSVNTVPGRPASFIRILPKPLPSTNTDHSPVMKPEDSVPGSLFEAPAFTRTIQEPPTSTHTAPLLETPPDEISRTPSPVDPPFDEKDLPIGADNVDWKRMEYFPPREVSRLYHRVRRRLYGESRAKTQRLYYRKEGRPPFSYLELAAMAIENEPFKSARFSSICDFVTKHFRFYSLPRVWQSKYWKHTFRNTFTESNYFRVDHIGCNAYYSFKSQYRLPTDPAIFENTEEVPTDSGSEECDEPEPELPDAEPNPLVPICAYSDEEMEAARESLVEHVNEFLALGNNKALSTGDVAITHEDLESVNAIGAETVYPINVNPIGTDAVESVEPETSAPAVEDPVYDTATLSCQDATDRAISSSDVRGRCPVCDFTSPDGIQLLWHVNASH